MVYAHRSYTGHTVDDRPADKPPSHLFSARLEALLLGTSQLGFGKRSRHQQQIRCLESRL